MNSNSIAIVGCGPAGLLAAHAAALADYEPVIYSKEAEPSPHASATFLHRGIPDLTGIANASIYFGKLGTPQGYAAKVYGDPARVTSWDRFHSGNVPAWNLAPVYEALWARYRGRVYEVEIDAEAIRSLLDSYPLVVNTAPAWCVCEGDHGFRKRDIWIRDGASAGTLVNSMIYSGSPLTAWYRSSDIFGTRSTEFAHEVQDAVPGIKVVDTNCDCHPQLLRAGRWGTWKAGELMHQAFEAVEDATVRLKDRRIRVV